jgi:hypothetical protein
VNFWHALWPIEGGGNPDEAFQAVSSHQLKDLLSFSFLQEIQEAVALFERLITLPTAVCKLYNIVQLPSDPSAISDVNKSTFFPYTGKANEFIGHWSSISVFSKRITQSKVMFN